MEVYADELRTQVVSRILVSKYGYRILYSAESRVQILDIACCIVQSTGVQLLDIAYWILQNLGVRVQVPEYKCLASSTTDITTAGPRGPKKAPPLLVWVDD